MLIILTNFLSLIDCQRCQISLCDRERPSVFKRVFDLQRHDLGKELETPFENRLPLKGEITENVAITGQKINLVTDQLLQALTTLTSGRIHSWQFVKMGLK